MTGLKVAFARATDRPVSNRIFGPTETARGNTMEEQLREAIIDELKRQAENSSELEIRQDGNRIVIIGAIDVDAIVMVVAGSIAGGP
ncbi:hypothetical protein [Palleronia sp.]|uniref:hypothetical protein n=1 Tax=Palleronia sp. TaxID=1940284 RepID=UPI0035C842BB